MEEVIEMFGFKFHVVPGLERPLMVNPLPDRIQVADVLTGRLFEFRCGKCVEVITKNTCLS